MSAHLLPAVMQRASFFPWLVDPLGSVAAAVLLSCLLGYRLADIDLDAWVAERRTQ